MILLAISSTSANPPNWVLTTLGIIAGMGMVGTALMPFVTKQIENGKTILKLLGVTERLDRQSTEHTVQLNGALDARIEQAVNKALAARDAHAAALVATAQTVLPRPARSTDISPVPPGDGMVTA